LALSSIAVEIILRLLFVLMTLGGQGTPMKHDNFVLDEETSSPMTRITMVMLRGPYRTIALTLYSSSDYQVTHITACFRGWRSQEFHLVCRVSDSAQSIKGQGWRNVTLAACAKPSGVGEGASKCIEGVLLAGPRSILVVH
jgi:hypothetical protein